MLSDKEKQEIREGFNKKFVNHTKPVDTDGNGIINAYPSVSKDVANYFLSIIEQKVKEKLESVEKGVEELPKVFVDDIYKGANLVRYTDVLGIIHKHKGE